MRQLKPCKLWTGAVRGNGYGQLRTAGKVRKAHREAYRAANGLTWDDMEAVPVVRHTCDNRLCVEPEHLLGGTQSQNMHDKKRPGKVFLKPTPEDVVAIKVRLATGEIMRTIAADFGVSRTMISEIKRGASWKPEDLPDTQ